MVSALRVLTIMSHAIFNTMSNISTQRLHVVNVIGGATGIYHSRVTALILIVVTIRDFVAFLALGLRRECRSGLYAH